MASSIVAPMANKHCSKGGSLTGFVTAPAAEYRDAIKSYKDLRDFLKKRPTSATYRAAPPQSSSSSATLYSIAEREDGCRTSHFDDASECVQELKTNSASLTPQMLFLKGYPSAAWVTHVGSSCRINPKFFKQHFSFRNRREDLVTPALPSSCEHTIRLCLMTVGSRENRVGESNQGAVDRLRRLATNKMRDYLHKLQMQNDTSTGISIVRGFYVLDEKHFVIEQTVSICLSQVPNDARERWWMCRQHRRAMIPYYADLGQF
jgi:hypothetical protein